MEKFKTIAKITAMLSVLLVFTVTFYIVLKPNFYVGQSETIIGKPSPLGGTSTKEISKTEYQSYLEVNGLSGLIPLAIPVILSLFGFWALFWKAKTGKVAIWVSAILLLLFSFLAMFSIGMGYIPAVIVMIIAAIFNSFLPKKKIMLVTDKIRD